MIVAAVLVVLTAAAAALYGTVLRGARVGKAEADARAIAAAVALFSAHVGRLPAMLDEVVTPAADASGHAAGPFLSTIPAAPEGWSSYTYAADAAAGTFTVRATGDGIAVAVP